MKLGNQGFGIKEMIIYTCLLVLLLIFVSIQIDSLYRNIDKEKEESKIQETQTNTETEEQTDSIPNTVVDYNYYRGLETRLKIATQNYLDANPHALENGILTIDAETLTNFGYLPTLYAQDGTTTCTGYSNVYQQEDNIVIHPYITCYNYQTSNNN